MKATQKRKGLAMSMPAGLAAAALTALVMTLGISLILAKLMLEELIAGDSIGYSVMAALIGISFISAGLAVYRIKRRKILVCMLSGILYWASLLCITTLFFGGQYGAVGETLLMILLGSGGAAALSQMGRFSHKPVKIRRRA